MNITQWILGLGACALGLQLHAAPMGSAFTYQGRLDSSGALARDGLYDFRFTLHDAATAGSVVGVTGDVTAVPVTNGLFTVRIDFLASPITTGEARWLQLQVNTNGIIPLIPLEPRQRLTPTPQAIYAGTASGVAAEAVGTAGLASGAVTSAKIADRTIIADDLSAALLGNTFWGLAGNAGTTPGVNSLGTTDNQPLEIKINNRRVLRLEPGSSPRIIGGFEGNLVSVGLVGATIAGGGTTGRENNIGASFATIGGGLGNTNIGPGAVIGGGVDNVASGETSTIGGGAQNRADGTRSAVGGGLRNSATGNSSFVGGGMRNNALNLFGAVVGGAENTNQARSGFIGGGERNEIDFSGEYGVVGGGARNQLLNGRHSVIAGGGTNFVNNAYYSVIGGGHGNQTLLYADWATIAGGSANVISTSAEYSVISGGLNNLNSAQRSGSVAESVGQNGAIRQQPGESVTRGDRRRRELEAQSSSPPLARLPADCCLPPAGEW